MKYRLILNFFLVVFIIFFIILGFVSTFYDSQKKYDNLILKRNKNLEIGDIIVEYDGKYKKKLIPGYHYRLYDNKKLNNLANSRINDFNLDEVNSLIFNSLAHYKLSIDIRDSFIQFLLGKINNELNLAHVQNVSNIINTGVGFCDQAVIVLNHIAKVNNKDFRTIQLNGHLVTEVKILNNWYYADPDYGFTLPISYQELINLKKQEIQKLISHKLLNNGFSNKTVEKYLNILISLEDNYIDYNNISNKQFRLFLQKFNLIIICSIIIILSGLLLKRKNLLKIIFYS